MGNNGSKSTSTTNQTYNTTYINKNDTNLLNSSVNSFMADTVSNQAKNCSASISQIQNITFKNVTTGGDFVLGEVDQNQSSAMTFDCVQVDTFKNDIANGILSKYMDALQNNFSTDVLDKLEANAKNAAQNSFGSTGSTSTNTKNNQNYTFNSTNTTRTNIENVIKNSIQNNVSMESVQNCIANVKNNQSIDFQNLDIGGNVKIGVLSQTQGATLLANCMQTTDNGNKVTNNIASELGLVIDNTNSQTKTTTMEAKSEGTTTNQGVGDAANQTLTGAGNAINSVLSGTGKLFSGLTSGSAGKYSSICCSILICLLIIGAIVGGLYYYKSQGGELPSFNNMSNMEGGGNNYESVSANLYEIAKVLKNK